MSWLRWPRAALRLLLVGLVTGSLFVVWLLGQLLLPWPRPRYRWRNLVFRSWARSLLAVMGFRVASSGTPPEPPFLLVANHLSYVDILVLASRVDAMFVAKSEIADWPVFGLLCRSIGTVFVDRGSRRDVTRVVSEIDEALGQGRGVILFPEGTSSRGDGVAPFRPALLASAARSGHPVAYAALSYHVPDGEVPAHLSVCWWGDMTLPDHLFHLLELPHVGARLCFGEERIRDEDRKRLADRLRQAVVSRFEPVVDLEEEWT